MKKEKGITLVALIITMIILLILATVSISLIMNSGIIYKTKYGVDKYSEEEIGEQIKLAYLEYRMTQFTDENSDISEILKQKLESSYGAGNVDIINTSEDIITLKINENGNPRFFGYNVATGESGEIPKGIN